jgi:hypothetical protein
LPEGGAHEIMEEAACELKVEVVGIAHHVPALQVVFNIADVGELVPVHELLQVVEVEERIKDGHQGGARHGDEDYQNETQRPGHGAL